MSMQDPIADTITRIRNGMQAQHESVTMPSSKLKFQIAKLLHREGYINAFEQKQVGNNIYELTIKLRYYKNQPAIRKIVRVSKPSIRHYAKAQDLTSYFNGLGLSIVSTNKGLMTDKECKVENIGGEILFKVF